ncbi:MAG: hypothetical protein OSJ53_06490 [Kineothrix sp.]|nr:hypothetical protein [Kineothrix sp.]
MTRSELIDILVKERTQGILEDVLRKNDSYQAAMKEYDKACEEIEIAGLDGKQKEAVDEALSSVNHCMAIYGAVGYRQGLEDGIELVLEILKVKKLF